MLAIDAILSFFKKENVTYEDKRIKDVSVKLSFIDGFSTETTLDDPHFSKEEVTEESIRALKALLSGKKVKVDGKTLVYDADNKEITDGMFSYYDTIPIWFFSKNNHKILTD